MNPFAAALVRYHEGDASSEFVILRDDGFSQRVPASLFFASGSFPALEAQALDLCKGRVLDIGAAAGRHSLELIARGFEVASLDVLPEVECILRDRGAQRVIVADILTYTGDRFDTLLMLMNGIGMVGAPDGLRRFLRHAHQITTASAQILCDSIDVSITTDPGHVAYRRRNLDSGRFPGQQSFTMSGGGIVGEPFEWLHLDFGTLSEFGEEAGWQAELIDLKIDGHYLCRLIRVDH